VGEKKIESVANLTREAVKKLLVLLPLQVTVCPPLENANQALDDLKAGKFQGAAVLVI